MDTRGGRRVFLGYVVDEDGLLSPEFLNLVGYQLPLIPPLGTRYPAISPLIDDTLIITLTTVLIIRFFALRCHL